MQRLRTAALKVGISRQYCLMSAIKLQAQLSYCLRRLPLCLLKSMQSAFVFFVCAVACLTSFSQHCAARVSTAWHDATGEPGKGEVYRAFSALFIFFCFLLAFHRCFIVLGTRELTSRWMVEVTAPFFISTTLPCRVAIATLCSTSNKPVTQVSL